DPARGSRPRVRHRAGLLRLAASRSPPRGTDPRAAGLLRSPHLPAHRPRRGLPHAVGGRPVGGAGLTPPDPVVIPARPVGASPGTPPSPPAPAVFARRPPWPPPQWCRRPIPDGRAGRTALACREP